MTSGAVGPSGLIAHYGGKEWKRKPILRRARSVRCGPKVQVKSGRCKAASFSVFATAAGKQKRCPVMALRRRGPCLVFPAVMSRAFGTGTTVRHFDGKKWQDTLLAGRGASSLTAAWASSARDIWAVGQSGTVVHYTGQEWAVLSKPTTENLTAMDGSSARDIWAVGDNGESIHYDGEQWGSITTGETDRLTSVASCGARDVWAVGVKGVITHWDGRAGVVSKPPTTSTCGGCFAAAPKKPGRRRSRHQAPFRWTVVVESSSGNKPKPNQFDLRRTSAVDWRAARRDLCAALIGHFAA